MPTFDRSDSECVIYVYREGIASAVGHDLAIEVGDFTIELDEHTSAIEARFAADSLRVRHSIEGGQPQPGRLSAKDQRKIERTIARDVLEASRFGVISFRSTEVSGRPQGMSVTGVLQLHGVEHPIVLEGTSSQGHTVVRTRIDQRDFGITPFRALMGALKVKAEVDVELRVPFVPEVT